MSRLLFFLFLFPLNAGGEDQYHIDFSGDLGSVTVEACFDGDPPRQLHRNTKAKRFTEWVRTGGRDFDHRSAEGRLNLRGLNAGDCVEWRVDIRAAAGLGDYRLALPIDDALLTSGDLWFWRDDDRRRIRVNVDLPQGTSLSTPWKEQIAESGQRSYFPERTPASWSSKIAVGGFPIRQLPVAGTELRVAVLGQLESSQQEALAHWIKESADSVVSVHGRFPRTQPQILVTAIGAQREAVPWAHVTRGGGSAAIFYVDENRPISEFRSDWTATHELSHFLLPSVSSQDRWLSEGLASYYQNVLRARDGRLTEQQAWQKLNAGFERGKRATKGGSLAHATRSGWGATMRVYWSGAAMMLKADARLRALSGGRQSLDSALEGLQACCFENGRSWRAKDLFAELDKLTGFSVFSEIYADHVTDSDFPDVDQTYVLLGIEPKSGSVKLNPDAPWGRIRVAIMKESRFPAPACGGRRLRSTAYNGRATPLVPLASLDLPNRDRRVACGSNDTDPVRSATASGSD